MRPRPRCADPCRKATPSAPPPAYLIAKTLGHSLTGLTSVYEHILMENEGLFVDAGRSNTPKELLDMGVPVAYKCNLAL